MNILLVYPQYPDTFWSFKHALKFVSKKAAFPPLGLLTVAAMLPEKWDKKLIDMNISRLIDNDIEWADLVFISAMEVQKDSVRKIVAQCNRLNATIVAGGPLFTTGYMEFEGIDHFVLGEAETTLQPFLSDLEKGQCELSDVVGDRRLVESGFLIQGRDRSSRDDSPCGVHDAAIDRRRRHLGARITGCRQHDG